MACSWSSALPRSSAIPRRSCARRRGASVTDGLLVLLRNKLPRQVRMVHQIMVKLRGWMRGARSIEAHRKSSKTPTAMATRRGRLWAAWRRGARVFGCGRGRRLWGIYGAHGGGLLRKKRIRSIRFWFRLEFVRDTIWGR